MVRVALDDGGDLGLGEHQVGTLDLGLLPEGGADDIGGKAVGAHGPRSGQEPAEGGDRLRL
jgi:hypothetical protein